MNTLFNHVQQIQASILYAHIYFKSKNLENINF